MSKYLFVYHGGKHPDTEEGMAEVMTQWRNWFGEMGAAVADGGAPVGKSSTVHAEGAVTADGGANPTGGYSIISAESMEQALELAKGCPILKAEGSVEVAEVMNVDM